MFRSAYIEVYCDALGSMAACVLVIRNVEHAVGHPGCSMNPMHVKAGILVALLASQGRVVTTTMMLL